MKSIALYCKSYSTDLRRVVRLARSVREHNAEKLPFYVSAVSYTHLTLPTKA